jgi:hypothetical protein
MLKTLEKFAGNVLSREEMKQVKGGEIVFMCSCVVGVGTWYYPGGGMPSSGTLTQHADLYCGGAANTACIYGEV